MHITFNKLRWKNFLSTGKNFTEIDLTTHNSTLVVGENGAGKSTMLDALSFVLYNKPFRKINKPQLVNSINNKHLLVEVEFSIGHSEYLVRRGIKPTIFEIFCDGMMLDQQAMNVDSQEHLEKNILHLSHRGFLQIVIIGRANYTPFMQLKTPDRRAVIEDILDIEVFTKMALILRDRSSSNKQDLVDNQHTIDLCQQEITIHSEYQNKIHTSKEATIAEKEERVVQQQEIANQLHTKINNTHKEIATLVEQLNDHDSKDKLTNKYKEVVTIRAQLTEKHKKSTSMIAFFENHDSCPTCFQPIEVDFKDKTVASYKKTENEISNTMERMEQYLSNLEATIEAHQQIHNQMTMIEGERGKYELQLTNVEKYIASLREEIEAIKAEASESKKDHEREIAAFKKKLKAAINQRKLLLETQQLIAISSTIVKDSGIRAQIVRQYVPIINKLINKYLAALDFFVSFELDETFNETIKSRHRDGFSYNSFSEGEKMRIDLAVLFTWRAVSKLRNSISTNLLIMDEVFDSSLDNTGTDEFLKIIKALTADTNTFIISHKGDQLFDKFDSVMRFEKVKNFSKLTVI